MKVDNNGDREPDYWIWDLAPAESSFKVALEARLTSSESKVSNSYTMGCPPVRGDNPRALASGLSYVQVDKYGITILYHLHQCRPCTSRDNSC